VQTYGPLRAASWDIDDVPAGTVVATEPECAQLIVFERITMTELFRGWHRTWPPQRLVEHGQLHFRLGARPSAAGSDPGSDSSSGCTRWTGGSATSPARESVVG
jgi:hypothetical protein